MIKVRDIYDRLNDISPFELQESWDNSGLIIGDMDRDINEIVVSLDINRDILESAKEDTLFIVHHPLIFSAIKKFNFALYPYNLIEVMVKKRLSLIAMHTNFDKTHLNRYVFEKVLGFNLEYQVGFISGGSGEWSKNELFSILKSKLNINTLKVISPKSKITSIALTTGSGGSLIDEVKADCFLTGDIGYHDAVKAMSQNLMMVDIGHYESEKFFVDIMRDELKNLALFAIISQSKNPFETN